MTDLSTIGDALGLAGERPRGLRGGGPNRRRDTALCQDRDAGIMRADGPTMPVRVGQWLQEDPIGFRGGDPNLRRYVGNDSMNGVDPSGLVQFGPFTLTPTKRSDSKRGGTLTVNSLR
jgi:RHS repeat-associated protein